MVSSISQKSEYSQNSENKQVRQRKKWEFHQTKKYYEFLLRYRSILEQTQKKQKQRIYNRMAQAIGSRSTHQCRSHHQKVMKRYDSIDNFIDVFKRKLQTMSDPSKFQMGVNQEQGNGKKKSKLNNKTKLKLKQTSSKQGLGFNLQQELKKLIQINRSSKQKQQFVELLRTLKGYTDRKDTHQNRQTHQNYNPQFPEIFTSSSDRKNFNLLSFNDFQNSLPLNKQGKSQSLLGSSHIQSSFDQRKPLNEFSTISNDQNYSNYEWVSRVFQNTNNYERFFSNIYPMHSDQKGTLQPDYSYVPLLIREMADVTLNSKPQLQAPQSFLYKQNPEQMIENAPYVCASIIKRENLNFVNPYIKQKNIILTPQKIQIPYKKDQNSNMWIQCVKVEQFQEDEMANSNSEQIERERIKQVLIEVLKKQGFLKNNEVIVQKQTREFSINTLENNGKQDLKPIYVQKKPKIEENHKFNPQFSIHHSLKPISNRIPDRFQTKQSFYFQDEYMKNKLEGKEISEKMAKTAPSWEDAEKQYLNQQIEKQQKYYGISKNYSYHEEGKPKSVDQKRNQFLSVHQNQQKMSNFPPMQEPNHAFNYHGYSYPQSEVPNFPHFYPPSNHFHNYRYHPDFPPVFHQQKKNYGSNISSSSFLYSPNNQNKGNFQQRRNNN